MLHVILMILKIIGIVIVSLLGLFLFLLAIVLFVPVRYRIKASRYDSIQANARVSWLCRAISLRVIYSDDDDVGLAYRVKILGFTFLDSKKPKKEKVKKIKKAKVKSKKQKTVKKDKSIRENKSIKENKLVKNGPSKFENNQEESIRIKDTKPSQINLENKELREQPSTSTRANNADITSEQTTSGQSDGDMSETAQNGYTNTAQEEKESLFERITKPCKLFCSKVKNIFLKIRSVWATFRDKIKHIRNIFSNIKSKISLCKAFLADETNRAGIARTFRSIKKWLKHICPYKIKGQIHVGLDDPCNTGYLLGALSMIYPLYADKIEVVPDFAEEVLEGYIDAKGRIRVFTLLVIGIKLILDSNFKMLIKNVKVLKEEF